MRELVIVALAVGGWVLTIVFVAAGHELLNWLGDAEDLLDELAERAAREGYTVDTGDALAVRVCGWRRKSPRRR